MSLEGVKNLHRRLRNGGKEEDEWERDARKEEERGWTEMGRIEGRKEEPGSRHTELLL